MPWDESRLAAVEASASECLDACAADVVSLVAEVARLTEQLRIAHEALELIAATNPSGERYPGACGTVAEDALTQMSAVE